MPPPGFNHMNAFGFGVPRAQNSKVMPFMGIGNNSSLPQANNSWGQQHQHPPQQNINYQQAALAHDHFQNHLPTQQGLQMNKSGMKLKKNIIYISKCNHIILRVRKYV